MPYCPNSLRIAQRRSQGLSLRKNQDPGNEDAYSKGSNIIIDETADHVGGRPFCILELHKNSRLAKSLLFEL